MVLCASPEYVQLRGHPEHPRELAMHATIAYSYWSGRDEWRFHGQEGEVGVRIQPIMRANNGDTCMTEALAHLGVILQPTFLVGEALRAGKLCELMPQYRCSKLGIYAVYPQRMHVHPCVS